MDAVVYVSDLDRCREFYEQALGLSPVEVTREFAVLSAGSCALTLVVAPREHREQVSDPPSVREGTPIKLVLRVGSIAGARERAAAWGGHVKDPDCEWHWQGTVRCDGTDPEGNVVQLMALP